MGDKMDKNINYDNAREMDISFEHGITLSERKNIVISGVKKIDSFDSEEFLIDTSLGYLNIKGSSLEIIKLDTYQGTVSIKGKIDGITYLDNSQKQTKEETFFSKLFK